MDVEDKSNTKNLEAAFKRGILDFRFYLEDEKKEKSYPNYTLKRFISKKDEKLVNSRELKDKVDKNILEKGTDVINYYILMAYNIFSPKIERESGLKKEFFSSTIEECSTWQVKKSSSNKKRKELSSKTIFAATEIYYKDDPNTCLMALESKTHFSYLPHMFFARCNVLFPPIAEGEIWTVGFIQFVETDSMINRTTFSDNMKFVFKLL